MANYSFGGHIFRALTVCSAIIAGLSVAPRAEAASILTQNPQGTYTTNILGGSHWTTFTAMFTAQHTYTETADFSNLAELQSYDAIWVDQELDNSLSLVERTALNSYVSAGGKIVLIGENNSWLNWNASIMQVVGGDRVADCSFDVGTAISANSLTSGAPTVENECGSTIVPGVGGVDILYDNNLAGVYTVGLGEALVILDSNWNDDTYIGRENNLAFAQNVIDWLGEGIAAPVPEPNTLTILGLGLVGLGLMRRRRTN